MKNKSEKGLTILEALIVILTSVFLLWVIIPVLLVRYGYKDAGIMVVTEGVKNDLTTDNELLRSRIKTISKPIVIDSGSPAKEAPVLPVRPKLNE